MNHQFQQTDLVSFSRGPGAISTQKAGHGVFISSIGGRLPPTLCLFEGGKEPRSKRKVPHQQAPHSVLRRTAAVPRSKQSNNYKLALKIFHVGLSSQFFFSIFAWVRLVLSELSTVLPHLSAAKGPSHCLSKALLPKPLPTQKHVFFAQFTSFTEHRTSAGCFSCSGPFLKHRGQHLPLSHYFSENANLHLSAKSHGVSLSAKSHGVA